MSRQADSHRHHQWSWSTDLTQTSTPRPTDSPHPPGSPHIQRHSALIYQEYKEFYFNICLFFPPHQWYFAVSFVCVFPCNLQQCYIKSSPLIGLTSLSLLVGVSTHVFLNLKNFFFFLSGLKCPLS